MYRNFKEAKEEALGLGINIAGLTRMELEKRISDKKNNTGIYATSIIDPDMSTDRLVRIADNMDINYYFPTMDQTGLVKAINEKLEQGYKLNVRYNDFPVVTELSDSNLNDLFVTLAEKVTQNKRDRKAKFQLEKCRGELVRRQVEVPKVF